MSMGFNANLARRYGSLYFADHRLPDAVPATITTGVPASVRDTVKQRFSVGPICDGMFWRKERSSLDIDRGPCM